MEDLSRFIGLAFSGRAVLLSGQDLEPGTGEQLARIVAESADRDTQSTFADTCAALSDPAAIIAAAKSVTGAGASPALRRVAEVPWAAVFTSAIDDTLSAELARQYPEGRRLRHLSVDERMPAFFPGQNDVLTVVHLMHIAVARTPTGVPLYGRQLARAQRLLIPGVSSGFARGDRAGAPLVHRRAGCTRPHCSRSSCSNGRRSRSGQRLLVHRGIGRSPRR